jgi:hypothetical protein
VASDEPTFEIVGEAIELSDAALSALAALLLDAADRARGREDAKSDESEMLVSCNPALSTRRGGR